MADWSLIGLDWPVNPPYDIYPSHYPTEETEPLTQCYKPQDQAFYPQQGSQLYPEIDQIIHQLTPQYTITQYPTAHEISQQKFSPPPGYTMLNEIIPALQAPPIHQESNDQSVTTVISKGDSPREIRNRAEKQRRDKLNHSISELASMVPPVLAASRKIDKTGVLRLTAHYLRAYQYVFGDSIDNFPQEINASSTQALLQFLNGFLITTTYKGIVVVVSPNVHQYLGYSELDLYGQSIFNIIHEDDRNILRKHLQPKKEYLGPNGELLVPDEADGKRKLADALTNDKKSFIIRFKKHSQRSEQAHYLTCHVEGSMRKSDRACRGYNKCCQIVRRARARSESRSSSGNDVVFIGLVRPTTETFMSETELESFRMEYRTRHLIDGEIIQCEQRIALVTGYMTHEVHGVNAMNFMHKDDVRWVIIALREMYDQHRLVGESCYRLMAKNAQFIYMKTRGCLEVDSTTRAVKSFICLNTVVDENEGKHLIRLMKQKFQLIVNNNDDIVVDEPKDDSLDNTMVSVEDPKQLEKVILHLVTNLPSPLPPEDSRSSGENGDTSDLPLAIIPPKKERIVSAIGNIYNIIKNFRKDPEIPHFDSANKTKNTSYNSSHCTDISSPHISQSVISLSDTSLDCHSDDSMMSYNTISNKKYRLQSNNTNNDEAVTSEVFTMSYNHVNDSKDDKMSPKLQFTKISIGSTNTQADFENKDDKLKPETSNGHGAVKRSINFQDPDMSYKKKFSKSSFGLEEKGSDSISNLFDDSISNLELPELFDPFDQTVDSTFSELLIPDEVTNLLGDIIDDTPKAFQGT